MIVIMYSCSINFFKCWLLSTCASKRGNKEICTIGRKHTLSQDTVGEAKVISKVLRGQNTNREHIISLVTTTSHKSLHNDRSSIASSTCTSRVRCSKFFTRKQILVYTCIPIKNHYTQIYIHLLGVETGRACIELCA